MAAAALGVLAGSAAAMCEVSLLSATDFQASGIGSAEVRAVAVGPAGVIYAVGSEDSVSSSRNWVIRKYDAGLTTLLGVTTYNGPGNYHDDAYAVTVDGTGNVIVAGKEGGLTGGENWRVRKYDATLTALLATTDYNGAGGSGDSVEGVAVDAVGNILVAGYQLGGTEGGGRIRKYDAGLTTVLANVRPLDDLGEAVILHDLALDRDGNIFVAGYEQGAGTALNWYILKYDATLATMFARTGYDGPASVSDEVKGLTVDPGGNPVVVGFEQGSTGGINWRITRYNPGLTAVLGTTDYDGPAGGSDIAYVVVVDGEGSIIVTGKEAGTAGGDNWRIRKYSASLDVLLATTEYSGPAASTDWAYAAALDGAGDLIAAGFHYRGGPQLGLIRRVDACGVPVGPGAGPTPTPPGSPGPRPVGQGELMVAPNRMNLSMPQPYVRFHLHGDPGAEVDVRIYDAAGFFYGVLTVILNAGGTGQAVYTSEGLDSHKPAPGAYWALATGGGVSDRRAFFVTRRK